MSGSSGTRSGGLGFCRQADWTADTGTADTAIAVGILGEVLLMIVLGVPESVQRANLCRDFTLPGTLQFGLVVL